MRTLLRRPIGPAGAETVVAATERGDGDVHPRRTDPATLERRQRAATGRVWVMTNQVHGIDVHTVRHRATEAAAVDAGRDAEADVIAASSADVPLAIWAADCAALMLIGERGAVVAAHAGWRGLAAGIVDVAAHELAIRGDAVAAAVLGPGIHPCCYSFDADERRLVAAGVGMAPEAVAGTTVAGAASLDVPAAVAGALRRHGVELDVVGPCTGCDGRWFSHRRGDAARHAVVVWRDRAPDAPGGGGGR